MLLAPLVQASMVLDRSILVFAAGDAPRQDVTITNPDPETMFVEVEVLEVRQPGTDKEERIVVRNPEEIGLIATPKRLVLPSGASRVIRLVNLAGHGDTERVYRVNVKPVAAPEEQTPSDDTEKRMSIKILIGYQLLIFVDPQKRHVAIEGRRDGNQLYLANKGNVNAYLYDGRQCKEGETREQCASVEKATRLYPGNEKVLTLPRDQAVEFQMETAGQHVRQRFD
jgi:P pilus assembly chaperone PapD